jgi:hypothetical protein
MLLFNKIPYALTALWYKPFTLCIFAVAPTEKAIGMEMRQQLN